MQKFLGLGAVLAVMAVAGCETVQGAGRDMQHAGQAISQESAEVQAGQANW